MQISFTRQRVNCDHMIWIIRKANIDERSESIDLVRDLEQSELIRPITKQGMLYITCNKLIEASVFGF